MKKYCFGIDVGGTTIKAGLFEFDLEAAGKGRAVLVKKWEIPTRTEEHGTHVLPDIAAAMHSEMNARGLLPQDILGVGLGVPGPVLANGIVNHCVNLGWEVVPAATQLSMLFHGLPVRVANDANVAALGESVFGSGAGYEELVMLTLGTGLGCGIVTHGKIIAGRHGSAGEFGHAPLYDKARIPCRCGRTGCLEQIASATGIVRRAKELLAESGGGASELADIPDLTAKDVLDACVAGDPIGREVAADLTDALGKGMAIIATVVDPDVFVIGGGVSRAGQWLIDQLKADYQKYAFFAHQKTEIVAASLGNDAGIYGAVSLVTRE